MSGRDNWWANFEIGWRHLLDPDNPFVPWLLVIDLVLIALHLFVVYWVYRDALYRYNRGAPWALFTMFLPVVGWLFYLFYRSSSLVQFDRIEAEMFDPEEPEWTDYDTYQANQGSQLFTELSSLFSKPEKRGYNPWIQQSRRKELGQKLTPEEKKELAHKRKEERAKFREDRLKKKQQRIEERKLAAKERKKRTTMVGAHGFQFKLSDSRQRKLKNKMEVMEKLKLLPREDDRLEELIYEMKYTEALSQAQDSLMMAEEMQDDQGLVTYRKYIDRLSKLIDRNIPRE